MVLLASGLDEAQCKELAQCAQLLGAKCLHAFSKEGRCPFVTCHLVLVVGQVAKCEWLHLVAVAMGTIRVTKVHTAGVCPTAFGSCSSTYALTHCTS